MCALQIQAEHASTLNDNEEQIMNCIEKYITKQVRWRSCMNISKSMDATGAFRLPEIPICLLARHLGTVAFVMTSCFVTVAGAHDAAT